MKPGARLPAAVALGMAGLAAALVAPGRSIPARAGRALQPAVGESVYQERCEVCHGLEGDGNGPAAENMDPRPRDFRRGWYKIRSTASGQLPTDADLIGVITEGMPGTTMPAWGMILTAEEIGAVAEYIQGFSRRFERETPEPVGLVDGPGSSSEAIEHGGQLFRGAEAECVKCHGVAGRGDGPSAGELTDDFGQPIVPADLTAPWRFRGGPGASDIYLRLKTGLTGSPMPSYAEVLSDAQLWDLAYFVDSLSEDAAPRPSPFILAARIDGPLPTTSDDPSWEAAEPVYYPLIGQLMREPRNFTPRIQEVWLRALHNGTTLVLRLEWNDRTAGTEAAPDSIAVQFPGVLSDSDERPYFVFGGPGNPVNLWVGNTGREMPFEQDSAGVGTRADQAIQNLAGALTHREGHYSWVVSRPLDTGDGADLRILTGEFIPIAVAASDGASSEDLESGAIGSWQVLYLEQPVSPGSYLWIPAAAVAAAGLEWGVARRIRKSESMSSGS